ncbi:major facilitator superfamily transporter [Colletotrichum karsti]|uniref:Molybdate-anion transporter n=1 Tax=Colletotrichum karsti TaxID=1095194 RepID=A0A9P6I222_9PEZI|nr:major facilitator superfamily transporter [Colletotrichum karsti]KAF9875028.1 major facilitator superfamily transporter [Colletotrichum karsti]
MDFYSLNLAIFVVGNGYLLYRQYKRQQDEVVEELKQEAADADYGSDGEAEQQNSLLAYDAQAAARKFQLDYFPVYALAMAADWLQGPHIYAIYKYEKNIPEKIVAALYAAGFVSGAISASFAGELADRHGRRLACIIYFVTYILTCLTMLSDNLFILFVGRFCGGISTTLLYSVFEAWLITEYHQRGMSRTSLKLGAIFGNMTTISSIVAILSGIFGDILVNWLGGRVWPFMASAGCSVLAVMLIMKSWRENYGGQQGSRSTTSVADVKKGIQAIVSDRRVLSLGLTLTFFEGAMYLFVFFWSAALKSARTKAGSDEELPFGLIFSSFMCSMMAGSAFFSLYTKTHTKETTSNILMAVVLVVSGCLSGAVLLEHEQLLFWALCMIEACIGAYFPSMSFLKSEVVEDSTRGRVYSLLRLPLNVFVVVAHSLDEEGDDHRNAVFITCAALLMVSFFIVKRSFTSS